MKANSNSEIIEEDLKSTEKLCNQPLFQEYENQCYVDAWVKIWYKMGIFGVRDCFQSRVNSCSFLLHPSISWYLNYITYDWPRKAIIELCSIWLSFVFFLYFLLVCVACVALGIFWVRDWFQSRVKSCSFLLHPSMLIPQLHNIWLTKKGHYRVMLYLIIFCFLCVFFLHVLNKFKGEKIM